MISDSFELKFMILNTFRAIDSCSEGGLRTAKVIKCPDVDIIF